MSTIDLTEKLLARPTKLEADATQGGQRPARRGQVRRAYLVGGGAAGAARSGDRAMRHTLGQKAFGNA